VNSATGPKVEKTGVNILRSTTGIGILSALAPSDQDRLASLLLTRAFGPNETIFLKGDEGRGLYFVRNGRIKICVNDCDGKELIFTYLSAGDLLGEIAILDGLPRSAGAVAVTRVETFYLDRRDFLDFLKSSPQACIDIIVSLCKDLRRVSAHLEEVSFLDVSGRIARKLISLSAGERSSSVCSISQDELARVVGSSRVMANKILNSFVDLGFISLARKRITVVNEHELSRIADYDRV
jgi:CRP/FNR family transcriptional regulator, cyclic AMP receptor protein